MAGEFELKSDEARRFFKELQRNVEEVVKAKDQFAKALAAVAVKDIDDHFQKEEGPSGRWASWSKMYREHMERIGKGGNKILQDKRDLYKALKETNYRTSRDGVIVYNNAHTKGNFPYAAHHDETAKVTRPFMWLSKNGMEKIEEAAAFFLIK